MKKFVFSVAALAFIASSSLSAKGPNNPANFETAKAQMSEMADKRMNVIKEFKTCVSAAADMNALKECRNKEADAMKEMRPKKTPRGGNNQMNDANGTQRGMGNRSMM